MSDYTEDLLEDLKDHEYAIYYLYATLELYTEDKDKQALKYALDNLRKAGHDINIK
jgi:23S rRNA G2445 N2-methylase RlmL